MLLNDLQAVLRYFEVHLLQCQHSLFEKEDNQALDVLLRQ